VRDADGKLLVTATCTPDLQPGQRVSLILGSHEAPTDDIKVATDTATFRFKALPPSPATHPFRVRLRVDGVDSVIIDSSQTPPVFTGPALAVS
jgi:hypothetical protein